MSVENRIERIRTTLAQAFAPEILEIEDESHLHVGHPGARSGGHFHVRIISREFEGRSSLERHRMIYAAVANLMHTDIHALRLQTLAPGEISIQSGHGHHRGNR